MTIRRDPHAIIKIERPGLADGQSQAAYDTWETKRLIKEVNVELATNQSSEARITFFDPHFRIIDAFSDATAKAIVKVYLGFGQDLGEPVFKGILAQIERGDSDTTMIVFDMAYIMKLVKRSGYKNKKDDLAIIKGLVERNNTPGGLPLKFEGPSEKLDLEPHQAMTQDQMSDWDWLVERARDAGLVFYVREDTVFVKKPAKTAAKPVMTLINRKDFSMISGWDFTYRTPENEDGKPKVIKHQRRGRNGRFIRGTSDEGKAGRDHTVIKRDMANPSKSKLTKRAKAQKDLEKEYAFEGRISTLMPNNGARPDVRNTVEIQEVGKLFSGKYLARTVSYKFGPGQLNLDMELYRDMEAK